MAQEKALEDILHLAKEALEGREKCRMFNKGEGCDACNIAACGSAMGSFLDLIIKMAEGPQKESKEEAQKEPSFDNVPKEGMMRH